MVILTPPENLPPPPEGWFDPIHFDPGVDAEVEDRVIAGWVNPRETFVIAMHGDPGAGKDAVAEHLVANHGFKRLAFADRLKEACEALDPIVHYTLDGQGDENLLTPVRLAEAVGLHGWDVAKKLYPEVRRTQQRLATEVVRDLIDYDYWVNVVGDQIAYDRRFVITDLRFPNEYEMVRLWPSQVWWIQRPDNPYGGLGDNASHVSETFHPPTYRLLVNDGALDELHAKIDVAMTGGGFASHEITVGPDSS